MNLPSLKPQRVHAKFGLGLPSGFKSGFKEEFVHICRFDMLISILTFLHF